MAKEAGIKIDNCMKVMKFGGTSVGSVNSILSVKHCVCQNCEHYFLTCNGHRPKYCGGMAPQDSRLTCRQYGAMMHQKEQNKQHPVYRLFSTRTNTIRKHHQRGKISDELRREALYLAETYRDRALMDNDYAAGDYVHDMEQETLYAQARARLAREDKP